MSNLWTNERYFSTYEEALSLKNNLQLSEKGATMQFKIRRCGIGKSQYVVKSRIDPTLIKAVETVEKQLTNKSLPKKKK
jgi:hypothetical protein